MGAVRLTVTWEACIDPEDLTPSVQNDDIFVTDNVFSKILDKPELTTEYLPRLKKDIENGLIPLNGHGIDIFRDQFLVASFCPFPVVQIKHA